MFRLRLTDGKSFTWNSRTDKCSYIVGTTEQDVHELSLSERHRRLSDLIQDRKNAPGNMRTLYTAFMMKIAQGFSSFRQATKSLKETRMTLEAMDVITGILKDIFYDNIQVGFTCGRYIVDSMPADVPPRI